MTTECESQVTQTVQVCLFNVTYVWQLYNTTNIHYYDIRSELQSERCDELNIGIVFIIFWN